jgi:hypothetical protein
MKRMVGRRLVDDSAPAPVVQVTVYRRWWQPNHVYRSPTDISVNVLDSGVLFVNFGVAGPRHCYAPGQWVRMTSKVIDNKAPGLPR